MSYNRLAALARHVPFCVLSELIQSPSAPVPRMHVRKGTVLFVDIGGFTALSQALPIHLLSHHINSYFSRLIDEIHLQGGQVVKFAGDALFAVWFDESKSEMGAKDNVAAAAWCGSKIVGTLNNYQIDGPNGPLSLGVKAGCGYGAIECLHVGTEQRRQFLISGEASRQATTAESSAHVGDLLISQTCFQILKSAGLLRPDPTHRTTDGPQLLTQGSDSRLVSWEDAESRDDIAPIQRARSIDIEAFLNEYLRNQPSAMSTAIQQLEPYVHQVIRSNDRLHLDRVYSAELRTVLVFFMNIDSQTTDGLIPLHPLQQVMGIVTDVIQANRGHLYQFLHDDKGYVIIGTFGLHGATFEDLVSSYLLPTIVGISEQLAQINGLITHIGATSGNCYCGTVGHLERHEYSILGPSVNLAARLMCSTSNPGILIDERVQKRVNPGLAQHLKLRALSPVKAKGYSQPVPIFGMKADNQASPFQTGATAKDTSTQSGHNQNSFRLPLPRWTGRLWKLQTSDSQGWYLDRTPAAFQKNGQLRTLLSREMELEQLGQYIQEGFHKSSPGTPLPAFVCIGEAGSGKTSLIEAGVDIYLQAIHQHSTHQTPRLMGLTAVNGSERQPYAAWSGIIGDILDFVGKEEFAGVPVKNVEQALERRVNTVAWLTHHVSPFSPLIFSLNGFGSLAQFPAATALREDMLNPGQGEARRIAIRQLCIDLIMHWLHRRTETGDTNPTLLVIDDAQWMDQESWKLLQMLWQGTNSETLATHPTLLILMGQRPMDQYWKDGAMPSGWLSFANAKDRLRWVYPGPLDQDDTRHLMGLEISQLSGRRTVPTDIDRNLDVHARSGGNPLFILEFAQALVDENLVTISQCGQKVSLEGIQSGDSEASPITNLLLNSATVEELLVAKLDLLTPQETDLIRIAAALGGGGFTSEDMALIHEQSSSEGHWEHTLKKLVDYQWLVAGPRSNAEPHESTMGPSQSIRYHFAHQTAQGAVLAVILPRVLQDVHRTIALAFNVDVMEADFDTAQFLLHHWLRANDGEIASGFAMRVGATQASDGFSAAAIQTYRSVLTKLDPEFNFMEVDVDLEGHQKSVPSIGAKRIHSVLRLLVELGKCLADVRETALSATAYVRAVHHVQGIPEDAQWIQDRASTIFPIYSGLLLALKWEEIPDNDQRDEERRIVSQFVEETKRHGDPTHICRALAMLGNLLGQTCQWNAALSNHDELESLYNQHRPDQISQALVQHYRSDRAAQNFPMAVQWAIMVERDQDEVQRRMQACRMLFEEADLANSHNSFMLLFPYICILTDPRQDDDVHARNVADALSLFMQVVRNPWDELHRPEDNATTYFLSVHPFVEFWLRLLHGEFSEDTAQTCAKLHQMADEYEILSGSKQLHSSHVMSMLGRSVESLLAESYLYVATLIDEGSIDGGDCPDTLRSTAMSWLERIDEPLLHDARARFSKSWEQAMCRALHQRWTGEGNQTV